MGAGGEVGGNIFLLSLPVLAEGPSSAIGVGDTFDAKGGGG